MSLRPLDRALYDAHALVRELRSQGLGIEAQIVTQALAVAAAAAMTNRERYEHTLISLHELACQALDEMDPNLN